MLNWTGASSPQEDPRRVLYFAHMFFLDHLFSTCWTVFFGIVWWVYTPHDGRRVANSDAQRNMMDGASGHEGHNMTAEERAQAALGIWNKEKGFAAAVLITGWLIKVGSYLPIQAEPDLMSLLEDLFCSPHILLCIPSSQGLLPLASPVICYYQLSHLWSISQRICR